MPVHKGSCHCSAITFEFEAPTEGMVAWDCNCKQADQHRWAMQLNWRKRQQLPQAASHHPLITCTSIQ